MIYITLNTCMQIFKLCSRKAESFLQQPGLFVFFFSFCLVLKCNMSICAKKSWESVKAFRSYGGLCFDNATQPKSLFKFILLTGWDEQNTNKKTKIKSRHSLARCAGVMVSVRVFRWNFFSRSWVRTFGVFVLFSFMNKIIFFGLFQNSGTNRHQGLSNKLYIMVW